jgi:hypothetical protein
MNIAVLLPSSGQCLARVVRQPVMQKRVSKVKYIGSNILSYISPDATTLLPETARYVRYSALLLQPSRVRVPGRLSDNHGPSPPSRAESHRAQLEAPVGPGPAGVACQ